MSIQLFISIMRAALNDFNNVVFYFVDYPVCTVYASTMILT